MTVITWWMPVGVSEPLNKGRRPAVLKAIIREAVQHGCCTMSTLDLADVAMCNSSTVRSVIKFAIEAGLIIVKDGTIMLDPAWLKIPARLCRRQPGGLEPFRVDHSDLAPPMENR